MLVGAVIVCLLTPAPAFACSCVEYPGEKETLQGYEAAATARLIEVKHKDSSNRSATLVYRVLRVYKNKNLREGEELVLRNQGDGAACGLPRNKKKRYGLRLYRDRDDRLNSSLCSRSQPARSSAAPLSAAVTLASRRAPAAGPRPERLERRRP